MFAEIRHPEELSIMLPPKVGKIDKTQTPTKGDKHQHTNGTQEDGLISPVVLTPGLTPTSPYTPGIPPK